MQKDAFLPSDDRSDAALAVMAADGSGEAFDLLAQRMAPVMNTLAMRYRHVSGLEAEDLLQEGLLGLLAAVHAYQPLNGAFFSFAAACIRNRMISLVRRHLPAVDFETSDAEASLAELPDEGQADPVSLLIAKEEAQRLFCRLRELLTPLEYRVLTAHLAKNTYRQIAEKLAISEKAVDNALQRVRQKLSKDGL